MFLKLENLFRKKDIQKKNHWKLQLIVFDQLAEMKNNMSVEWLINQLATKKEWEEGHNL